MVRSINKIIGYKVIASDGDIGKVHDFYFDDDAWTIRYLVVNTGGLLIHNDVLISPITLKTPDWANKVLRLSISRQKVETSPDKQAHQPVSRQKELELAQHYTWPAYWAWSGISVPVEAATIARSIEQATEQYEKEQHPQDQHLRSIREVRGYNIHAKDESIGHIEDFIVDDEKWVLRYLVIDTRNWLPGGKKVLISPEWAEEVDWGENIVKVDMAAERIKESPEFDPAEPINREYEVQLYDFYGRPKYWM